MPTAAEPTGAHSRVYLTRVISSASVALALTAPGQTTAVSVFVNSDRLLILSTMVVLGAATVGAGWVHPGWTAGLYGVALGVCNNGVRTLEAVAFPRCFGLRHIGSIRGVVHSITIGASAFGPLMLALGRSWATSYRPVLLALVLLPLAVGLAAASVRYPPPVPPGRKPAAEAGA